MNCVIDTILTRRSVRSFSDKEISKDDLLLIAKCACYAPSALNRQKWTFTVVNKKEQIEALAKAIGTELGQPNYDFYNPNAIIIASSPRDYTFAVHDCSGALENMFLAAHSLGIGSVWINQLCGICDNKKVRGVLDSFCVPKDDVAVGVAALGYPNGEVRQMEKDLSKINFVK